MRRIQIGVHFGCAQRFGCFVKMNGTIQESHLTSHWFFDQMLQAAHFLKSLRMANNSVLVYPSSCISMTICCPCSTLDGIDSTCATHGWTHWHLCRNAGLSLRSLQKVQFFAPCENSILAPIETGLSSLTLVATLVQQQHYATNWLITTCKCFVTWGCTLPCWQTTHTTIDTIILETAFKNYSPCITGLWNMPIYPGCMVPHESYKFFP